MTEQARPRTRGRKAQEAAEPAPPEDKAKREPVSTDFVVLQQVHHVTASTREDMIGNTDEWPTAWVPVHRTTTRGQSAAIEEHTGKGEGAKVGTFRAVAWSLWKGTETVDPPRQVLEDVRARSDEE